VSLLRTELVDVVVLQPGADWPGALRAAAARGGPVVVDLGQVEQLDSAALGVLLAVHRDLGQAGAGLVLRGAGPRVQRTLRISGLGRLFGV
jgi:anti-anti-sigma factor